MSVHSLPLEVCEGVCGLPCKMCEDVCELSLVNGMWRESIGVSSDLYEGPCGVALPNKLYEYDSCFSVPKEVNEDAGGLLDELYE